MVYTLVLAVEMHGTRVVKPFSDYHGNSSFAPPRAPPLGVCSQQLSRLFVQITSMCIRTYMYAIFVFTHQLSTTRSRRWMSSKMSCSKKQQNSKCKVWHPHMAKQFTDCKNLLALQLSQFELQTQLEGPTTLAQTMYIRKYVAHELCRPCHACPASHTATKQQTL